MRFLALALIFLPTTAQLQVEEQPHLRGLQLINKNQRPVRAAKMESIFLLRVRHNDSRPHFFRDCVRRRGLSTDTSLLGQWILLYVLLYVLFKE